MSHQDPNSSGILSGVFDFISRELESFVATATGGQVAQATEQPTSSRSNSRRSHKRYKRSKGREAAYSSSSEFESEGEPRNHRRQKEGWSRIASRNHRKRIREPEEQVSKRNWRVTQSPSHSCEEDDTDLTRKRSSESTKDYDKLMPPPPVPVKSQLKRSKSNTMPGSLYPRSPSIDPDPLPNRSLPAHVQFTPSIHSDAGPSSSRTPTSSPSTLSPVKAAIQKFSAEEGDADPTILLPQHQSSPTKSNKRKASLESLYNNDLSEKARGKRRESHSTSDDMDFLAYDDSGVLRVRGKERELKQAIQAQQEHEIRRERQQTEEPDEFDPFVAESEVQRDKKRIRQLEEEINLLKEELARRSAPIDYSFLIPSAPPPPPPPPPPNKDILRLPRVAEDPSIIFTVARASLNHAPTPKEKPINPPHMSRRQGQPTVGVTPEKMAAFLQEMKTVRLKKTGNSFDSSNSRSSDSSRRLSSDNSFSRTSRGNDTTRHDDDVSFLSRSMIAPRSQPKPKSQPPAMATKSTISQVGVKRKRPEETHADSRDSQENPHKRPALPSVKTNAVSNSSSSGFSSSSQPILSESSASSTEATSSDRGQAAPAPSQSDLVAHTPSLCSDNDPEHEDDDHDQPPSTPPPVLRPSRSFYRFRGNGIPVTPREHSFIINKSQISIQLPEKSKPTDDRAAEDHEQEQAQEEQEEEDVDGYEDSFIPIHPVTPEGQQETQAEPALFQKRVPVSPLPSKSPRKPHPPSRRRSTPHPKKLSLTRDTNKEVNVEAPTPTPLAFSSPDAISTPGYPNASTSNRSQSQLQLPIHTPDIFNDTPVIRSRPLVSRIPVPSSRLHPPPQENTSAACKNGRRLTLDDEMWLARRSDEITEEEKDDLEDHVYVGTGSMNKQKGFMAHGGAGGVPVFMGVGYVEGAEED